MNRYITGLEMFYFQGHKHTKIGFTPTGINVFIGASDVGKSTCIKAIEWVSDNRICGERPTVNIHNKDIKALTKKGNLKITDETRVIVTFSDGHIIEKKKGKELTHIITYPDGTVKELSATGMNVPEEVKAIFGFTELNHATQANSYFILFDSPQQIAKRLNEIVDMTLADKLLTKIKSEVRKLNSKKSIIQEDVSKLNKDLEDYKGLEEMEQELSDLSNIYNEIDSMFTDLNSISDYSETWSSLLSQAKEFIHTEEKLQKLSELITSYEDLGQLKERLTLLSSYLNDLKYLKEQLTTFEDIDAKIQDIDNLIEYKKEIDLVVDKQKELLYYVEQFELIERRMSDFRPVEYGQELEHLLKLAQEKDELSNKSKDIEYYITQCKTLIDEQRMASESLEETKKELEEMLGDKCPVCGRG